MAASFRTFHPRISRPPIAAAEASWGVFKAVSGDSSNIDRLRELAACLERGAAPPAEVAVYVAAAIRRVEVEPQITLDQAFGLRQAGKRSWRTNERQKKRYAAIVELHAKYFPDLGELEKIGRKFERSRIKLETEICALLEAAAPMPGLRQLQAIVSAVKTRAAS